MERVSLREKGRALMELLIALFLSGVTLVGTLHLVTNTSKHILRIKSEAMRIHTVNKIDSSLNQIMRELDQHRFSLKPRIHSKGSISYSDSTLNPISLRNDLLKPSPDSDAITSVSLKAVNHLKVVKIDSSVDPSIIYCCAKFSSSQSTSTISNYESFIGVTTLGFIELSGKGVVWQSDPSKRCYSVTATPVNSMIAGPFDPHQLPFVTALFPVERLYTLYVDMAGRLRYLGHKGELNIENQPIIGGIKSLDFSETLHPALDFLTLTTNINLVPLGQPILHTARSRLSRMPLLNTVLN